MIFEDDFQSVAWRFVLPNGAMGDLFVIMSFLSEFKRNKEANLGVESIELFYPSNRKKLVSYFENDFQLTEFKTALTDSVFDFWHKKFDVFSPNKILICHPKFLSSYSDGSLRHFRYGEGYYMDKFATCLNLPADQKYSVPYISSEREERARSILREINNPKKSILISPFANSIDSNILFDNYFWEKLTNMLVNKGYDIYINQGDLFDKRGLNFSSLDIDIDIAVSVFKEFKSVIALRSGFCDVLSNSGVNLTSIIPSSAPKKHLSCVLEKRTITGCVKDLIVDIKDIAPTLKIINSFF